MPLVLVSELAKRIGRTPETIKRWADQGFIPCERDDRNRRIFREEHVGLCREIARLSISAQTQNRKLSELVELIPVQLGLLEKARPQ